MIGVDIDSQSLELASLNAEELEVQHFFDFDDSNVYNSLWLAMLILFI